MVKQKLKIVEQKSGPRRLHAPLTQFFSAFLVPGPSREGVHPLDQSPKLSILLWSVLPYGQKSPAVGKTERQKIGREYFPRTHSPNLPYAPVTVSSILVANRQIWEASRAVFISQILGSRPSRQSHHLRPWPLFPGCIALSSTPNDAAWENCFVLNFPL